MKKPFKTEIEEIAEKEGYTRLHHNVWLKKGLLQRYGVLLRCMYCGRAQEQKTIGSAQLQSSIKWNCEHCPTQHETNFTKLKVSVPAERPEKKAFLSLGAEQ